MNQKNTGADCIIFATNTAHLEADIVGQKYIRINKNALWGIVLNQGYYQYFVGVDLMAIEGLSHATLLY